MEPSAQPRAGRGQRPRAAGREQRQMCLRRHANPGGDAQSRARRANLGVCGSCPGACAGLRVAQTRKKGRWGGGLRGGSIGICSRVLLNATEFPIIVLRLLLNGDQLPTSHDFQCSSMSVTVCPLSARLRPPSADAPRCPLLAGRGGEAPEVRREPPGPREAGALDHALLTTHFRARAAMTAGGPPCNIRPAAVDSIGLMSTRAVCKFAVRTAVLSWSLRIADGPHDRHGCGGGDPGRKGASCGRLGDGPRGLTPSLSLSIQGYGKLLY